MKNVLLYSVLLCLVCANADAATPSEQLKQLTAQLQSNPGDTALREKIIKLARTMKPAPAVPAEAERYDGRGEYAFKGAKNEADYLAAANEYVKASNLAPWVASFYFNAATAFEKGKKPADAKRNFELYLLAAPDAKDTREVRRRIAGLEFAIEKANSPEAEAASRKEEQGSLLSSLEGARFDCGEVQSSDIMREEVWIDIRSGKLHARRKVLWVNPAMANIYPVGSVDYIDMPENLQRNGLTFKDTRYAEGNTYTVWPDRVTQVGPGGSRTCLKR